MTERPPGSDAETRYLTHFSSDAWTFGKFGPPKNLNLGNFYVYDRPAIMNKTSENLDSSLQCTAVWNFTDFSDTKIFREISVEMLKICLALQNEEDNTRIFCS